MMLRIKFCRRRSSRIVSPPVHILALLRRFAGIEKHTFKGDQQQTHVSQGQKRLPPVDLEDIGQGDTVDKTNDDLTN